MINPFEYINSIIKLVRDFREFKRERSDTFRKEAQRIIDAFEAHDIPPNEIMRLLPDGLLSDPSDLESALTLKKHLARVSPWAQSTLQLDSAWLKGRSAVPHQRKLSYKHLPTLVEFLQAKKQESADMSRFTIYVFKQDLLPVERSSGPMVIVLREVFAEVDDVELQRFYYLSEQLEFGHLHCLLNLMHILAFAHHYQIKVWGRTMKPNYLRQLDLGEGFIPNLWRGEFNKGWYPDDLLWFGLTGDPEWKERMQADLHASLRREDVAWLAEEIALERVRLASCGRAVVTL